MVYVRLSSGRTRASHTCVTEPKDIVYKHSYKEIHVAAAALHSSYLWCSGGCDSLEFNQRLGTCSDFAILLSIVNQRVLDDVKI